MTYTAVYAFPDSEEGGRRLAAALGIPCHIAEVHRFPDGESLVRLPEKVEHAILYRSLHRPNDKLIELLLAASVLRREGTGALCLIAPYLPYMRQDAVFRPGEPVSQKVVGALLAAQFDRILAVEPHLHRCSDMAEIFPGIRAEALASAGPIADHLWTSGVPTDAVVVGPDEESEPMVAAIAGRLGLEWTVARKVRRGDRDVTVALPPDAPVEGRSVIVADDVISSGETVLDCVRALKARRAGEIRVVAAHALHSAETGERFRVAGISSVASCDGIPHPSNAIPLAPLFLEALRG